MTAIQKPWGYDVSMEKLAGWAGNSLYFSARSTGGDSSDSLVVSLPTDSQSLNLLEQWIHTMRAK